MHKTSFSLPILIACQFIAFPAFSAGNINYLNVIDDTVYFSTDEAKTSTPECVSVDNAEQWTLSLKNKTGRAQYALLVTAMASKQAITIESAQDCEVIAGIERALGVSLQHSVVAQPSNTAPYSEIKATSYRTSGNVKSGSSSDESSVQRYEEFINAKGCPQSQGWRACYDEDIAHAFKVGDLVATKLGVPAQYPVWYFSNKVSPSEEMRGTSSNCKGFAETSAFGHAVKFFPDYPVVLTCNTQGYLMCCKD